MKCVLVILLFYLPFVVVIGQSINIDQINEDLCLPLNDTVKVNLYYKASQFHTFHNIETAIKYADSSFVLANSSGYSSGIIYSGVNLAYLYNIQGNYKFAINVLHRALDSLEQKDRLGAKVIKIYKWLGKNYSQIRQYDSAYHWTYLTLNRAKKFKQSQDLVYAYNDYGNIFLKKNDFDNAVVYYSKADSVSKQHGLNSVAYLSALGRLGKMKLNPDLYKKSLVYLEQVKKRFQEQNNPAGVAEITFSLGMLEFNSENLENSFPYLLQCLEYYSELNMYPKQMVVHKKLGEIYLMKNEFQFAKKHLVEYSRFSFILNDTFEKVQSQVLLAELSFKEKKYKEAQNYFRKSKKMALNINDIVLVYDATLGMAKTYLKRSDSENAAIEFSEIMEIQDSVSTIKKSERALTLFAEIQLKQNEYEMTLLRSKNELTEQQKTNQRNLLLGGIGLTSLAGIFFFFLYRNRQKTTKKLQELDSAKSNFFANISHEFRTPLTLISGPIQKQLKKKELTEDERNNFEMMQRNSNRLLSLVDQLLDISKIETDSLKLAISGNKILSFIGTLADGFTFTAKQKQLDYTVNINTTTVNTWYDKNVLEKIVINLLSNAVKYTPVNGSIVCNAFIKNDQLYFEVKNTGKGISKDEITKVFERFYQINSDKQGVGIGLALVKELVVLHKGSITVESTPNEWTVFKVVLPVSKEFFNTSEIVDDTYEVTNKKVLDYVETPEANVDEEVLKDFDEENPILLIVDDNADIRTYVGNIFKDEYSIYLAKNGQEGIDLALEHIPDIIISDIMMPIKNGIELCNTLKADERTSHIPIMLLTAKAGEENEIEGIKTGADDYITKPFNEDLLQLKVEKLIESRKKLQARYSQEIILRPKDIAVNSVDEQFLERIQGVLDDKLVESSFSIEEFSQSVGMSRMQLHRKLKALTGLSATEFIRSQRLKLAAKLLIESDINVSQIGYSVGFNNHNYFSKCFKEMYKCTPTQYTIRAK